MNKPAEVTRDQVEPYPAPEPFARPDNTLAVEKASGFGPKIGA